MMLYMAYRAIKCHRHGFSLIISEKCVERSSGACMSRSPEATCIELACPPHVHCSPAAQIPCGFPTGWGDILSIDGADNAAPMGCSVAPIFAHPSARLGVEV